MQKEGFVAQFCYIFVVGSCCTTMTKYLEGVQIDMDRSTKVPIHLQQKPRPKIIILGTQYLFLSICHDVINESSLTPSFQQLVLILLPTYLVNCILT